MRCPKCGYISFDRQRSCGKCSNDLTAVTEQLQGTVGKAASPFFLGAILGKQQPDDAEPGPTLHEEEEPLDLDALEADALPADEDELDFAGAPLDEDDQTLPSLGLEDIDVSDLMPPQEEEEKDEEELVLHLGNEQEETILTPVPAQDEDEKEDSLMGIEFPGFNSDDTLSADEKAIPLGDGFEDEAATPQDNAEDEEIIDLSSLMNFDEPPAEPAAKEEDHDIFELSLGDESNELHLSIEDSEAPPTETPKKSAPTVADIADLGLTLENDDQ